MAKFTTLFLIILLLCLTLVFAGGSEPAAFTETIPSKTQQEGVETEQAATGVVEESCEGIGEEECLMRRTLAAHIDYIYTQNHKP